MATRHGAKGGRGRSCAVLRLAEDASDMAPDQQLSFHLNSTDPQEKRSPMGVSPEDGGRRVGTSGARKHAQMEGPRGVWRPIHYLGSKLRLLEDICQAVDEADPSGG